MKQVDIDIDEHTPDGMTHLIRMAQGEKWGHVKLLEFWLEVKILAVRIAVLILRIMMATPLYI